MTDIRFVRAGKNSVDIRNDDDDGQHRGGFSGPTDVIDGIMKMQAEARLHRQAGLLAVMDKAQESTRAANRAFDRAILKAAVKGTGNDAGSAQAVAADQAAQGVGTNDLTDISVKTLASIANAYDLVMNDRASAANDGYLAGYYNGIIYIHSLIYGCEPNFVGKHQKSPYVEVNQQYLDEIVGVVQAANALVQRLSTVLEMPELDRLITAFDILSEHSALRREGQAEREELLGPALVQPVADVEDETDALDKVSAELSKASYFDLIMRSLLAHGHVIVTVK